MKAHWISIMLATLTLVAGLCLPLSARAQFEVSDHALDQELRWIRAEAEATVSIATKTEMSVHEAPSIVSVITEEEIRNSGAKNLEEVLRQIAGFYIYRNTTFPDTLISIRGVSQSANPGIKIMLDGHSLENLMNDNSGNLPTIPVTLVKKIEIIRGPGSALYGNEAMNGVINIITKDGNDPSAISAAGGSFGMFRGTGQFSWAEGDTNIFLFGDRFSGDGDPQRIGSDSAAKTFPPGYSGTPGRSNEDFLSQILFAKFSHKDVRLTAYCNRSEREPPVGITGNLTDENVLVFERAFAELAVEKSPAENTRLNARMYYDYSLNDFDYEMFGEETAAFSVLFKDFPEGESVFLDVVTETDKFGAELTMEIRPSDSLEIVAGLMGEYSEAFGTETVSNANLTGRSLEADGTTYMPMQYLGGMRNLYGTIEEGHRTSYAGYVQGTWDIRKAFPALEKIGTNLTLTAGLRYDRYDDVGDTLNPRMGVVYAPDHRFFFKALYGRAFRAPTFTQMYLKNNASVRGNPDLEPETVETAELLAGVRVTDRITATMNLFRVEKEDSILSYQGIYRNRGRIVSQGAEGEVRFSLGENGRGYLNVTFQKAEDLSHERITDAGGATYEQEDFNLGMYPEIMVNLGFDWKMGRHVGANVTANHVGSVERIGSMRFTSDPEDPDGSVEKSDKRESLDARTLVNLSLRFGDFDFAPGWEFQITGHNIFDTDHKDPERNGYLTDDFPRWDRHFMGKLTHTF